MSPSYCVLLSPSPLRLDVSLLLCPAVPLPLRLDVSLILCPAVPLPVS